MLLIFTAESNFNREQTADLQTKITLIITENYNRV
jgi:hypothetical protein